MCSGKVGVVSGIVGTEDGLSPGFVPEAVIRGGRCQELVMCLGLIGNISNLEDHGVHRLERLVDVFVRWVVAVEVVDMLEDIGAVDEDMSKSTDGHVVDDNNVHLESIFKVGQNEVDRLDD